MKTFLLAVFSLLTIEGFCQDKDRQFYFKEVGWAVALPAAFKVLDSAAEAAMNEKGKQVLESAVDGEVDLSSTITLFSATLDIYNYFNATLTPFDPDADGDWSENNAFVKKAVMEAFAQNIKDAKLDSSSSKTTIDGLSFDKFEVTASIGGKTLFTTVILSKFYKGYDFGISYLYMDEKTGKIIMDILSGSTFKKQ
jgi:hypothetical protein